ncbi:isochorismatase family protein [Rothia terrae]|uniref:isochorismatase family protein n=1 Tax=Rothia terrae TaxID=396015 RepID=UPI0014453962|nr:isochorismatase family protein [Rothia terrae]MDT0189567.1 isochorismatase family protein [Rothia terrae]NKZ35123.1 isochorismatase family protein [Rothia terrae]
MATFSADVHGYSLYDFSNENRGLGWTLDPSQCALLVHDFLPYYLEVLPENLQAELVRNVAGAVSWAQANDVPVVTSAPRPATVAQQRGLGGKLWGLGPSAVQTQEAILPELRGCVRIHKRSLSAFYATDLEVELRRLGKSQLIVAGLYVAGGIVATSFDALARDLEFFVVADAVADYTVDRHHFALEQIAGTTGQVVSLANLPR